MGDGVHGAYIRRCFDPSNADSVEDVIQNLKGLEKEGGDGGAWASSTLDLLNKMSPTSVAVTFRQLREGAALKERLGADNAGRLQACLQMEYRIAQRCMSAPDFREGIRALLVDKDHSPKWAERADVGPYFASLESELDLSGLIKE